jgi:nucleotide-binding universal stress UspA family protein
MPETAIVYDDVEVLEADGLGLTCRIEQQRVFIGKYVPVDGTTVHAKGDRGTLALPRWFVEQEKLPLRVHLSDREVEEWAAKAERRAVAAREYADAHPQSRMAQDALERARAELNAALLVRGRRGRPD